MKKILLITFLIGISFPTYSFATGEVCQIKDKSAQVLLDYIKDNRQVVKNVTKAIIEDKNNKDKAIITESERKKSFTENQLSGVKNTINNTMDDLDSSWEQTSSIFNEMFSFTGYFSYFQYFAVFPISNEIPYQVKRDYKILDNENKGLIEYIKKIDQTNESNLEIKNVCDGVIVGNTKCTQLEGKKSKEIIGELIQNNDRILDLFRLAVIGENTGTDVFKESDFILVDNNFRLNIVKIYGKEAINACNQEELGFFEKITKAITEIKLLNKEGEDGIEKWKKAWRQASGKENDAEEKAETTKLEREQLKKYLSNQGMSQEKQDIMLENLKNYNSSGATLNNNFLTNSFNSIKKELTTQLSSWKNEVLGDFIKTFGLEDSTTKKGETNSGKTLISNESINIASENSLTSIYIKESIATLYENEIPFAVVGDESIKTLRAKIIDTYFSLENSNKRLDKTIEISKKVCKAQDSDKGACE